jgi:hypothetical protein
LLSEHIKKIKAVAYLDAAKGKAKSQIIRGEDGRNYYVKFQQNPQGTRVLVNELVSNGIARFLGVPSPEGVLIEINREFLEINPALQSKFGERLILPGLHFGTEEIKNLYPASLPPAIFLKISNKADIAAIIVFDILMFNTDRNNEGNYLVSTNSAGKAYLHVIDHGHCLGGPNWNAALLRDPIDGGIGAIVKPMANLIDGVDPFKTPLSKLHELTKLHLENTLLAIPTEWNLTQDEKSAIIDFIMERKIYVESILNQNHNLFPFWRRK